MGASSICQEMAVRELLVRPDIVWTIVVVGAGIRELHGLRSQLGIWTQAQSVRPLWQAGLYSGGSGAVLLFARPDHARIRSSAECGCHHCRLAAGFLQ
mmetsp:Transcript_155782/g.499403  ORF Transcript_155782/g.499403 Transcript_155782/m.499403 type:complete len:98 (+) Transcript_155782:2938-3231(+)